MSVDVMEHGARESRAAKVAVSYIRVSTKEQAERDGDPEGYSLPAQRDANRRKAASLDAAVVEEFVERGESAKSAESRPELQRLLGYIKANPVHYVIVHKVDRLARNRLDDAQIHMAIKKAGAELISATENIDETPSGMLLHGIMSSIAEFYSHNLAFEVNKGMEQKARTGGTPGKAPIGYQNIRTTNGEGREARTVVVDAERAPHITWAFTAYATGEWTLKAMAAELEVRGLTTRPTGGRPGRPIKYNSLHKILTTRYYKGEVVYRGASYPGRHQPLVDPLTWARVQEVLVSHATGEKQREHPHYLKSSVYCGGCGSRLIITNAKNRHGRVYPYFVCLGRHQKTTDCQRKAVLIEVVEQLVEDEYKTVALDTALRDQIEVFIRDGLHEARDAAAAERQRLTSDKQRLLGERARLLQAHYAGAIPIDLLKDEQDRIARQLANVDERLVNASAEFDAIEQHVTTALDYAVNCYAGYLAAADHEKRGAHIRRLYNQSFFTKIYVNEDDVRVELAEPFRTLTSAEVAVAAREHARAVGANVRWSDIDEGPVNGSTMAEILAQRNDKPAHAGAGLKQAVLVPPTGFEPALPP